MYLSKQQYNTLWQIQESLQGNSAALLADILKQLDFKQAADNKKIAQQIKEKRKINPLYGRSKEEKEKIIARRKKNNDI